MGGPSAPRSLEKGAETPVWLATAPLSEIKANGCAFSDLTRINFSNNYNN